MPWLAAIAFCASALPAGLFVWNLFLYRRPSEQSRASVSILIPARDEESTIESCVRCALTSTHVDLEVIVLDDDSSDHTPEIVRRLAQQDPRLRLCHAPPLPAGWSGKQHACAVLAQLATKPLLCFVDADVRLERDALSRLISVLKHSNAALVSGFPRQETVTFFERLLLPLMHFILLGFLPIALMRKRTDPRFAAGCGQLFVVDREAYSKAGGHAAIRSSRHDGIMLPRAIRAAGLRTELSDLTGLAACRMYRNAGEVFSGLLKNATEGLAAPARIVPFTILLLAGQVLPVVLLFFVPTPATMAAAICAFLPRLLAAHRFKQPVLSALLHPLAITLLLALQWIALFREIIGTPVAWKGRAYSSPRS